MVGVIVFGRITILHGWRVSRRGLLVLIANGHRNRMQVLQRQADHQHQQSEFFQKTFHAAILIVQGQALQVRRKARK